MIIGKNTPMRNQNFNENFKRNDQNKPNPMNQTSPINTMQHSNIMDKDEMKERSFNMLQDRLNKGLISLDEFNKKCRQIGKIK